MRSLPFAVALTGISALIVSAAPAGRAAEGEDARAFMARVQERSGWNDMRGKATLTLRNAQGGEKVRSMDLWSKKNAANSTRSTSWPTPAPVARASRFASSPACVA